MYENQVYAWEDAIDAGEMDPEDIDVRELVYDDETHLTPKLEELLSEDQREEFARLQREKIDQRAEERERELSLDSRETLDLLKSTVDDTDEELTETVQLDRAEVTVTKRITGRLEQLLADIMREGQKDYPDFERVKDDLIDGILEFIIDDGEDSGYRFTDREVWEHFYRERGSEALHDVFEIVSTPARRRRERIQKFRGGQDRR